MDWQDEGMLLSVRPHGESSAIIEVLTAAHGRHAGLVRGARSRALAPVLQPGAQLALDWRARLAEHLGHYRVDPIASRAGAIMADRERLAALNAMGALLVAFLPEREPNAAVYAESVALADLLAAGAPDWPEAYARWEIGLLAALGFPLDLARCAATGAVEDLAWVSPRTGRAVSRAAGAPLAGRLLPLPAFLADGRAAGPGAVAEALALSGHFLAAWVCPAFEREAPPQARARLVALLSGPAAPPMAKPRPIG